MTGLPPLAALVAAALVAAALAHRPRPARLAALAAGLAAAAWLVATARHRRAWEATARAAAYVASRARGVALDRAVDLALAAACLALAGCVLAWTDRAAPPWALRVPLALAALCGLAALARAT